MKLRLLPILTSVIVSSVVLFGGWFVYHSVAKENPLLETVQAIEGVEKAEMQYGRTSVELELTLAPDVDLSKVIKEIRSKGASYLDNRSLEVDVAESASEELEKLWSKALFDVAEAMETKQYSRIPDALQKQAEGLGVVVDTRMDELNVYITMKDGTGATKHVIMPRKPATLGVWANE
ncbi:hypothetical protein [Paenibacillus turpanensis]|uniref:hypothetical protein n=1 Tax=Paenibacillus turpanensis TaxID=2689078 RepID=UPI001407905E|nr:hypothetical protein [Paenibacillus turpanensis]